jgi:IPT/TIG domain-containing protein/Kelch motif protein
MKTESTLVWLLTLSLMFHLTGCGSGGAAPAQPVVAQAPSISSISPSQAVAGGSQFTLTVSGANFVSGAVVTWNGNNRLTTFVSSRQLSAAILVSDIATTGTVNVAVVNPPNSLLSNVMTFMISAGAVPAPALAVTPSSPIVPVNATVHFSANAPVVWAVQEGAAGGTISSDGTYTAPQAPGLYRVIATAVPGSGKSADVWVQVIGSGLNPSGSSPAGNLTEARLAHTATLLPSGHVLVAGGGQGPDLVDGFFVVSGAEVYDPATASFSSGGTSARDSHTATLLESGQVLLAGGEGSPCPPCNTTATAELYDPSTGRFQPTGSMSVERESQSATQLKDGRVLIVGGVRSLDGGFHWEALQTAEIYDPGAGTFSRTGNMNEPRYFHAATLLADGKVLVTGGVGNNSLASAEVYDPATGSFTPTGTMMLQRHWHSATLLPDGKVLVSGGLRETTAEIYDPVSGLFTPAGSMSTSRSLHSATLLLSGTVLIAGGVTCFGVPLACAATATVEVYDPTKGSFTRTADLAQARFWHTATLLPDGRVLLVGGADSSDGIHTTPLGSAEIYK